MKRIALAVCAVALSAVFVCAAADVAGTWNVDGDVYGNPVKFGRSGSRAERNCLVRPRSKASMSQ